jgi:hypothetical protein
VIELRHDENPPEMKCLGANARSACLWWNLKATEVEGLDSTSFAKVKGKLLCGV